MIIVKKTHQYDNNCLFLCEPIKNNIINEGYFIRILYSTPHFIMNGIYLDVIFGDGVIEKYYNKYKFSFSFLKNKGLIDSLKTIEEAVLGKINIKNKLPHYKIYEQLKNGNIKFFYNIQEEPYQSKDKNNVFVLKISGIWESEHQYGVTYKFVHCNL